MKQNNLENMILPKNNSISRRDFLKTMGLTGLALATPNILQAREYEPAPPGIANCRDRNIERAWNVVKYNEDWHFRTLQGEGYAASILRCSDYTTEKVHEKTPSIEPAYWFEIALYDLGGLNIEFVYEIKEINKPLYYFQEGINYFMGYYIDGAKTALRKIEKNLTYSLFAAAGKDKKEADKYLNLYSDFDKKKKVVDEIFDIFKSYKPDKSKFKVNDDYNKLLTAQWAAFWLTDHYSRKLGDNSEESQFTWDVIEQNKVFRNINGEDLRIRGPPYYKIPF